MGLNQHPVTDVDQMREHLLQVWIQIAQNVIDEAINDWRKRLRARVNADSGHLEYLL